MADRKDGKDCKKHSAGLALPEYLLVVEDNILVAMASEATFKELGVRRIDIVGNVSEALKAIEAGVPDFALLDVNLGNETSFPIADRLLELGVPFAFASGYGDSTQFPEAHAAAMRLAKPFDIHAIANLFGAPLQ